MGFTNGKTFILTLAFTLMQGCTPTAAPSKISVEAPVITAFTVPEASTSLTVPILSLAATHNAAIAGYLVNESPSVPSVSDSRWSPSIPSSYEASSVGSKTLYAWAKDDAGHISASMSRTVVITLSQEPTQNTVPPTITSFLVNSTSSSLTVSISSFSVSSISPMAGYMVNESPTKPSVSDLRWSSARLSSYSASSAGPKVLYAWAKDSVGNISDSVSRAVTITLPNLTPPTITLFSAPSTSASLTIPITSFTATHHSPVTGYMVNESSVKPTALDSRWSVSAPTSYLALSAGSKVLYAFAKDAAGNISTPASRTVVITLPVPTTPTPSTPTYANTYYVSPVGSDSASGSSTSPWKTLSYACSRVTASNSLIFVGAGTYSESARCNLALGISIAGEGIDKTIIRSSYVASNSLDGAIRMTSSTHTNGNQSVSNLTMDGLNLTAPRAIAIGFRNNVEVHHVKIINFRGSAVFFTGSTAAWDVAPPVYASGNSLHNSIVTNCGTRSYLQSAHVRINGQSGFKLYNTSFDQTQRSLTENGNILGGEWNKSLKIYNNTFRKLDSAGGQWNFFTELWHFIGGSEIYGNTFYGAASLDIVDVEKSTAEYGLKIYNNKFLVDKNVPFDPRQVYSVIIEGRSHLDNIHIYDNYFKNVPNAIEYNVIVNSSEGYSSFSVNHNFIHHNVMDNVGMTDLSNYPIWIEGYGSNPNITINDLHIKNNTIHGLSTHKMLSGIQVHVVGKFSNFSIEDNIISNTRSYPIIVESHLSGSTFTNLSVRNNMYYNTANISASYTMPITNRVDQNNRLANPLFADILNGNYAPALNSPACTASTISSYVGALPCK